MRIEVVKVANGYAIQPEPAIAGERIDDRAIKVFLDVDSMLTHLRMLLEEKMPTPPAHVTGSTGNTWEGNCIV